MLAALAARADEAAADEMAEAVLRDLATSLRDDASAAAASAGLASRLRAPRWKTRKHAKRLDALWSWLETAAWFHARGDAAAIAAMGADAAEAGPALRLKLDGILPDGLSDPVAAVLPRLRAVLSADIFDTTADGERTARLAELLLLLDHPQVAELPWARLVARAAKAAFAKWPEPTSPVSSPSASSGRQLSSATPA